jgi:hypothetical protein
MEIGMAVRHHQGSFSKNIPETAARGACRVALHSKHTFTSAFGKVFYPRV